MDFRAKNSLSEDVAGSNVPPRAESNFRCPVCRASQSLQNKCRRCQADLSLVVLAYQRVNYLLALLKSAADLNATRRQLLQSELKLLSPRSLPF